MKRRYVSIALIAVALMLATAGLHSWSIFSVFYKAVGIGVSDFTPKGEVRASDVVLRLSFSGDVTATASLEGSLVIEPPLAGSTHLENSRTLVFVPTEPLRPATRYVARLTGKGLSAVGGGILQSSADQKFYTPSFTVTGTRLFYTMDPFGQTERNLMAEITFNIPVAPEALKAALSLSKDGQPIPFNLEPSRVPTRYYLRAGGVQRGEKEQEYSLKVAKGLTCLGCGEGLDKDYLQSIRLAIKPPLNLEKVSTHHLPGATFIALQFSLPVSVAQVRAHLSIEPALAVAIDGEHTYAVLKGDFKPNVSYKIILKPGLRAENGQPLVGGGQLQKDGSRVEILPIQDLSPVVRFGDKGDLISMGGPLNLSVKTVNLDKFYVSVNKVYRNNLLRFLRGGGYESGRSLPAHEVEVKGGQLNEEVESRLDVGAWHKGPYKGLYVVTLNADGASHRSNWDDSEEETRWDNSSRTVLVTDLGLLAKRNEQDLWVQVLSVSSLLPAGDVKVSLVSSTNQVMATASTDAQGRALFKDFTKKGEEEFTPYVLLAEKNGDFSYLTLDRQGMPVSSFNVDGDPYSAKGMEAYLASDRGLYRPGDTAHFTALVRKRDLSVPQGLPLTLKLSRGGAEVAKQVRKPGPEGLVVFDWPIRADLATGQIDAWLGMENGVELGRTSVKVEEFIPQKIKVSAFSSAKSASAGDKLTVTVRAEQLFGGPAIDLRVHGTISWHQKLFEPEGWGAYRFTDDSRSFSVQHDELPESSTNAEGRADYPLMVPDNILPPSMLQATVRAEVLDNGGRPVGAVANFQAHVYPYYLGMRLSPGQKARAHQTLRLDLAAVLPTGQEAAPMRAPITVRRRVYYSLFSRKGWNWRGWESQAYDETLQSEEVDLKGKGAFRFTPDKAGDYTIMFGGEEGHRCSLSVAVSDDAPGSESSSNLSHPERLGLGLDKERFKAGEVARLKIHAPFAGRLLLSLERETVLWQKSVQVPAGVSVQEVPVPEAALPNAYITALLVRRPEARLRDLPSASLGVLPLMMDTSGRKLVGRFKVPAAVKSREGIEATLDLGEAGAGARVVIAAVDEGILQIINFQSPDPFSFFYRKRGLTVETLCGMDALLPDLKRLEAVGGDEDENVARRHLNPVEAKRVKSFAWFSGPLSADAQGRVRIKVPTVGFRGEARLMAMAASGKRFGGATARVKVADPLIVEAPLPRFLAPGDIVEVPVTVYNRADKAQDVELTLKLEGPLAVDGAAARNLRIEASGQTLVSFHLKALNAAAKAVVRAEARGPLGVFWDETELPVRPASALKTVVASGRLKAGATQELDVPGGFISQGLKARLTVSNQRLLLYLRSLDYLITYPYGCGEQVASKVFPLLYFKDLGLLTGRYSDRAGAVEKDVQAGIDKLVRLQTEDGGFAYWEGGTSSSEWLSDYITHCFIEARRAHYEVPAKAMDAALKRLGAIQMEAPKGRLDRRKDNTPAEGVDRPYVLYLKALAGLPDKESMAAFLAEDRKTQALEDRCMVSLAYSALGDPSTARRLLPETTFGWRLARLLGASLDSPNRETALVLMALAESDPTDPRVESMVDTLGQRMKDGHFGTTQDDAWSFRALGAALRAKASLSPLQAEWGVDRGVMKALDKDHAVLSDASLSGHSLSLHNKGQDPLYYYLMAEGTPLKEEPGRETEGISASRAYFDETGKPLNLGSVAQGQLVVVRLEINVKKPADNLVIVDLLPAGLEVENPRLSSRGTLGFDVGESFSPSSADFRDDRVLLFTGESQGRLSFSYSCRAVSPGRYKVPALLVEAMYDPEIHARFVPDADLVVARRRP